MIKVQVKNESPNLWVAFTCLIPSICMWAYMYFNLKIHHWNWLKIKENFWIVAANTYDEFGIQALNSSLFKAGERGVYGEWREKTLTTNTQSINILVKSRPGFIVSKCDHRSEEVCSNTKCHWNRISSAHHSWIKHLCLGFLWFFALLESMQQVKMKH